MIPQSIEKLYKLLEEIPITTTNRAQVNHIKELLDSNEFEGAISELQNLKYDLSEESEFRRKSKDRTKT